MLQEHFDPVSRQGEDSRREEFLGGKGDPGRQASLDEANNFVEGMQETQEADGHVKP
jgi:hypothetical protein